MNTLQWNGQERIDCKIIVKTGYKVPVYGPEDQYGESKIVSYVTRNEFMASELADLILDDIARTWWVKFDSIKKSKDKLDKFNTEGMVVKYGYPPPSMHKISTYNKESVRAWATKYVVTRKQKETNEMLVATYTKHVASQLDWLNQLMVTRVSKNIGITEYCAILSSTAIHIIDWTKNGYLEAVPIEDAPDGMEMTKPSQLKHGIYNTTATTFFGADISVFKMPKRVKLVAGPQVDAVVPMPNRYCIADMELGKKWALGPIWVSEEYAAKFEITGRDGLVHPLETGDKLVGCLPNGTLVKGTAVVTHMPGTDMVVSNDADKKSCVFNDLTKLHVQSRAAERCTVGLIEMSYQLGQFMPDLAYARIYNQLDAPRDCFEKKYDLAVEGEYPVMPSLRNMVAGKFTAAEVADLFKYPIFEISTEDDEQVKYVSEAGISAAGAQILTNGKIDGFERQVQEKITDLLIDTISFPTRGAWAVAVPLRGWQAHSDPIIGIDDKISLPEAMWLKLGKPSVVAIARYPVKGIMSLVRLNVTVHYDHSAIEVSPLVQVVIESGDFDGDQDAVYVEPDVVARATGVIKAFDACSKAQDGVSIPEFETVNADGTEKYTAAQASFKLIDMDTMGLATVVRDMLINKVTEAELLSVFEWIVQPAIAGKEGAPYLSPFKKNTIEGMTGAEWIVSKLPFMAKHLSNGKLMSKPSLTLLMCSGRWYNDPDGLKRKPTLGHYIEVSQICKQYVDKGSNNPHSKILSAYSNLEYGFGPIASSVKS